VPAERWSERHMEAGEIAGWPRDTWAPETSPVSEGCLCSPPLDTQVTMSVPFQPSIHGFWPCFNWHSTTFLPPRHKPAQKPSTSTQPYRINSLMFCSGFSSSKHTCHKWPLQKDAAQSLLRVTCIAMWPASLPTRSTLTYTFGKVSISIYNTRVFEVT
jgi:hypothetical protein